MTRHVLILELNTTNTTVLVALARSGFDRSFNRAPPKIASVLSMRMADRVRPQLAAAATTPKQNRLMNPEREAGTTWMSMGRMTWEPPRVCTRQADCKMTGAQNATSENGSLAVALMQMKNPEQVHRDCWAPQSSRDGYDIYSFLCPGLFFTFTLPHCLYTGASLSDKYLSCCMCVICIFILLLWSIVRIWSTTLCVPPIRCSCRRVCFDNGNMLNLSMQVC
jgi:hypothetical protein